MRQIHSLQDSVKKEFILPPRQFIKSSLRQFILPLDKKEMILLKLDMIPSLTLTVH
jgi:hypothetical protein